MPEKIIIGITGLNGAGKGSVVDYFVKNKGFVHFSAGDLIIEEIEKRGEEVNRDKMREVGNMLREKYGAGYIAEELLRRAGKSDSNSIIESIRTVGEIESLRKMSDNFVLLAIEAEQKKRYERIRIRGSAKDNVSFEEFVEQERLESESEDKNKQNLTKCRERADIVINNDGSKEELEREVDSFLKSY